MKLSAAVATSVALLCLTGPSLPGPAGLFGVKPAAAAPESEDDLISRGVALRKDGDDQAARDLFRKAYERSHSPRAAGQLGLAEQALGRWEEAEIHLREALRAPNDPWVKKNHDALTRDMVIIKGHVARLEISGQPEGAEVVVNGHVVGKLPLEGPISITAGEVDLEARSPGYQHEVRKLTLAGGQYQQIVVRLQKDEPAATQATPVAPSTIVATPPPAEPTPPAPATNPAAPAPADQPPSSLRLVATWGALGLAGAGLAVGITSSVIRSSKLSQFKSDGCSIDMGRAVDTMTDVASAHCQSLLDSYNGTRTWQIVGFVSAGVFAATWLALFLTEPSTPSGAHGSVAHTRSFTCGPTGNMTGAACLFSM